jgi:hypothetical protein
MNFLAHLHLAAHTGSSLTGNLLGDFIKGPLPTGLADHFDEGIWLHRKIDAFTDAHPAHRAAGELRGPPGAASAALWWTCSTITGSASTGRGSASPPAPLSGAELWSTSLDHHSLPQGLPMALRRMAEQDWLASYQYREGGGPQRHRSSAAPPVPLGEALHALDQLAGPRPSTPSCTSTWS